VTTRRTSWDTAPAGLLVLGADGVVAEANATFLEWVGRRADDVVGRLRLADLLSVGGRIFWETHLSPLLLVEGQVDEVALELKGPEGRLPVLLSALSDQDGGDAVVRVALSRATERARYERELLAARAAAERSAAQVRALQSATAALSRALGVDGVATALLDAAVGPLGAAAATVYVTAGQELAVRGSRGEEAAALPAAGVLLQERTATAVDGRVVVALHGTSELQGVLSVLARDDPGADPLDLDVLTAVGQQAGLALDRALLYEQSADVARELQHSLLDVQPPQDQRFSVAAVYRPGVEMLEVGGDWYDVFLSGDGVLSIVVGDVVGRGLAAASAMGQLRSAVRAVAGPDVGPARLLGRLDRFVEQVEAAGMATLAYAELELATGEVRYACAGHPPPLLLPAHGEPQLLWEGRSTPLGALGSTDRGEASVRLRAGDRLLLCTDGLFERRDRSLDDGLDVLCRTAAEIGPVPLGEAVRSLTERLLADERTRDDVCVLLLAWSGGAFDRQVAADLTGLSETRRELASWLLLHGVDLPTARDLVLATSEAVANAAEHGSQGHPHRSVRVQARIEPHSGRRGDVVVQVEDSGRWRAATASPERGRGLQIIGALVDDVLVEAGDGTTVVLRRRLREDEAS
jgi:anti-sigma regulatory factor (Ser/Thr protein kinase)